MSQVVVVEVGLRGVIEVLESEKTKIRFHGLSTIIKLTISWTGSKTKVTYVDHDDCVYEECSEE